MTVIIHKKAETALGWTHQPIFVRRNYPSSDREGLQSTRAFRASSAAEVDDAVDPELQAQRWRRNGKKESVFFSP